MKRHAWIRSESTSSASYSRTGSAVHRSKTGCSRPFCCGARDYRTMQSWKSSNSFCYNTKKRLNRKGNFRMLSNNKNNTAWRRVPALLLTAVLVMSLLAACGKGKDGKDAMPGATEGQVVASYQDGGQVTEAEFNKYTTLLELTNPQMA